MRYNEISESRRNKEINQKVSAVDALRKFKGQSDVFVSFVNNVGASYRQDIPQHKRFDHLKPYPVGRNNDTGHKLGINPMSKFATPIGIYAYSVDYVIKAGMRVPFARDKPYIQVFRIKPSANIWYLKESDRIEWLTMYMEIFKDIGLNIPDSTDIAVLKKFYDKIMREEGEPVRKIGIKAASVLRNRGYDGVVDNGLGIIHRNEKKQAVFFTKATVELLETIANIKPKKLSQSQVYTLTMPKFVKDYNSGVVDDKLALEVIIEYFGRFGSPHTSEEIMSLKLTPAMIEQLNEKLPSFTFSIQDDGTTKITTEYLSYLYV